MGLILTSADKRVMIALPIDDRAILTSGERDALLLVRKYKWMIVIDKDSGRQYQLQPPTGGTVETHIMEWVWRIIDTAAVLTEQLTTYGDLGGIADQTTYEAGTPLEDIITDLLSQTRVAVLPSISLPSFTPIEKGTSGELTLAPSFALGDSQGWNGNERYYVNDVLNSNPYIYNNLTENVNLKVLRDYLACQSNPGISNPFIAGTAQSPTRQLQVTLPFFYGNDHAASSVWNPTDISQAKIQLFIDNTTGYRRRLFDISTGLIPTTRINIDVNAWNYIDADRYRWIMIPASWGKELDWYYANTVDQGEVGEDPFSTYLEINLSDNIYGRWSNEPYLVYCTAQALSFEYPESNLFYFTLK